MRIMQRLLTALVLIGIVGTACAPASPTAEVPSPTEVSQATSLPTATPVAAPTDTPEAAPIDTPMPAEDKPITLVMWWWG